MQRELSWTWPKNTERPPWVVLAATCAASASWKCPLPVPGPLSSTSPSPAAFPLASLASSVCQWLCHCLGGVAALLSLPAFISSILDPRGASPGGWRWRQQWSRTKQTRGLAKGGNGEREGKGGSDSITATGRWGVKGTGQKRGEGKPGHEA